MKKRVFVASSTEGLEEAHKICALLASFSNIETVIWTDVFQPGMFTFEALEEMLAGCSGAVFVATPDDQTIERGKTIKSPRSNILLEFGLVAGRLGRHSTAVCLLGGATLPSDLQGLTVVEMEAMNLASPDASEDQIYAQTKLRLWAGSLLATSGAIARTDIIHGYTGLWAFELSLDHWRGVAIAPPDFVYVKGTFHLFLPPNGQSGSGSAHGRLYFKLANVAADSKPYQGEYRTAHDITTASCDQDGSLSFTSQAFAVEKMNETGLPPIALSGLDVAEPWSAQWQLSPAFEPRTLKGLVTTDGTIGTHGSTKANKI